MSAEKVHTKCLLGPRRKKILKKFAETTSAHGLVLISKSDNTYKRVVWIVIVMMLWLICAFQTSYAIYKYYQWPTVTSIRIQHFTSIQFPAVTICNLNPVKASWLREQPIHHDEIAAALSLLKEKQNKSDDEWKDMVKKAKSAAHINTERESLYHYIRSIFNKKVNLKDAGHDITEMLLDCTFQSTKCTAENFTRWEHGSYGNCYTIIITREHYSFIGPFHGLSLTLHTQDDQYLAKSAQGAGFQVEVHSPEYIPFPEDKGFTISPGVKTSVGVKLQQISRMPWPYDGTECGDYHDEARYAKLLKTIGYTNGVNYTHQACINSCYQKRFIQDCNCVDASSVTRADIEARFPSRNNIEACDVRSNSSVDALCFLKVSYILQSMASTARNEICDKSCPQPCHEQEYVTEKAFALWPRESFYKKSHETWENSSYSKITNLTFEKARTNLLKLEVYFKELNYESIKESPAMDIWDLLSDIGGTLGLYVGVSFLTFGEVLELFYECFALRAREDMLQRAASKQTL